MRNFIRILVGAALGAALVAGVTAPAPEDLPATAFRQPVLYRLEIALLTFYGCLLLITPAFSGLIRGRLPIEISTRGARFAEGDERLTELDEAATKELERTVADLAQALAENQVETKRLSAIAQGDRKQQGIGSDHD